MVTRKLSMLLLHLLVIQCGTEEAEWSHPLCADSADKDTKALPCKFLRQNENLTTFLGKTLELRNIDKIRLISNRPGMCDQMTDVLIVVMSSVNGKENRDAIRSTWASQKIFKEKQAKFQYTFFVGTGLDKRNNEIAAEFAEHKDIIQIDNFERGVYGVTTQVAAMLNWFREFCPATKYILRTHDKLMWNAERLKAFIESLPSDGQGGVYGILGNKTPARDGQWAVSKKIWPWDSYPDFFMSETYLMGQRTAIDIGNLMTQLPYFPIEDVFTTGIVAPLVEAPLVTLNKLFAGSYNDDFWTNGEHLGYISAGPKEMKDQWQIFLNSTAK